MPRYEYRVLNPTLAAEKAFLAWIDRLDHEFANRDPQHRSDVVRNELHELYLGRPYTPPNAHASMAEQVLTHSFDPRNATLEPESYGDVDAAKYAERKPLIWFWMMFDRSALGINHWLGFRFRRMLARHIFKHIGKNVKIFHGVEFSFGYNLTIEDDCTIHKYVMLDDRGELIIRKGTSISDYAAVYSHWHKPTDYYDIENRTTEIGAGTRLTYHSAVMAGVKMGEDSMLGAMGVATHNVPEHSIWGGVPAKELKRKQY
jgi:acetyltransferase-like isoleucine patch superfamily enzyme